MKNFTFKKEERLSGRKQFAELFAKGHSFQIHPFRVIWILCKNSQSQTQAAFVVPKRNFKKAVTRNLIRRRMKEAYRLYKNQILPEMNKSDSQLIFAIIYSGKEVAEYKGIEDKIIVTLHRLIKETNLVFPIPTTN